MNVQQVFEQKQIYVLGIHEWSLERMLIMIAFIFIIANFLYAKVKVMGNCKHTNDKILSMYSKPW